MTSTASDLAPGAHLVTRRFGYLHHGLYAGNGRVIHSPGFKRFLSRGRVEEISLEEFAQGRGWQLREWPRATFSGGARVERARARLGEDRYRFWSNNCEHFVSWCIDGASRSLQVEAMLRRTAFFCFLLVAACAGLPEERPLSEPATDYAASRSLEGQAQWPTDRWWKAYGDPQLDRLIEEGIAGSPTLASAIARLQRAEALAGVSAAALGPQVSANGSIMEQKQSRNYLSPRAATPEGWRDYGRASLDLSWEIDFWGRNRAALAAATSDAEAARADAAQARLVLAASIASAYAELARLHAAHSTAVASEAVRSRTAALFRERHAQGLDTLGAVRQAEARHAASQAERLSLEEQLALQRNRLAALAGAGPDRGLDLEAPAVDLSRALELPANLPAQLVGRRPDVAAARLRVEAAASRIGQARASFYPNVNLAAFVGAQSLGLNRLGEPDSAIGGFGPALSLPLFDGGRLRGQLRATEADYADAVASYDRTVVQALQEVADAAASRRSLGGQIERTDESVERAREAWRIQDNRYRGGLATALDVLSAEETLLSSLRSQSDLHSRAFSLDVALARALGGGYAAPTSQE